MDSEKIKQLKHRFVEVAREVCPKYRVADEQKPVLNDIFNWCVMLKRGRFDPHKGLWIHGQIGSGKSTMLEIIRRFCGEVRPKVNGDKYSFRTTNAIEVCGKFSKHGYEGLDEYINKRRQAFDEVGSESVPIGYYGTAENVFQYILQRRYDTRYDDFTHVTTNLTEDQISEFYGARIYDRCREMFNFVEMNGKTFRKNN